MTRRGRLYRTTLLALGGTLSLLLLNVWGQSFSAPPVPSPSPLPAPPSPELERDLSSPPPPGSPIRRLSPTYLAAAAALRRRDCDGALARLQPLTLRDRADPSVDPSFARVVRGLYAHACERVELAQELLFPSGDRGPGHGTDGSATLEDWRLLTLADSAAALGHLPVARAALEKILSEQRTSPLFARALEKAAVGARDTGDPTRALELAEGVRPTDPAANADLPPETQTRLDVLVWEIGEELEAEDLRRRAARRLLIRDPEKADELGVERVFRTAGGGIAWAAVLSTAGLKARGRALAAVDRHQDALEVLEAVPGERRDADWRLLTASVLTGARRGGEALRLLAAFDREPDDRTMAARVEWERALAARDLATAHRGRRNLLSAERERWRRIARGHLSRVAELDGDRALSLAALRRLFFDLADTELDSALGTLRRLRALDPDDSTGADFLWRRGWERFQDRNYSTAIGYWAELSALYPEHRSSRSGRYWTGRAWEALGHWQRARNLYREVASADTTDFYRKYALERLSRQLRTPEAPLSVPSQEPEPWPEDPALARARLLTDLALDELALVELEAVRRRPAAPPVDPRAADALESEILHRKGDLRASIGPIRRAFPALGGPYQAAVPNRALRLYYPLAYGDEVRAQAQLYDLPVDVLYGMIRQESGFDPGARSRAGARGLLQLMPATAREVARRIGLRYSSRRLHEPAFNVRLGAAYFRQVLGMFGDHLDLALAGYNGGPYRIKRLWREAGHRDVDRFLEGLQVTESRIYVKRILVLSDSYRQLYGPSAVPRLASASRTAPSPVSPPAPAVGR